MSKTLLALAGIVYASSALPAAPIIGGQGDFKYQYMPNLVNVPAGCCLGDGGESNLKCNAHGTVTDAAGNIYVTYDNGGSSDKNCLIRWKPDGTEPEFMTGGNTTLCDGTAHGLKIATEDGTEYLYHANNQQKLTKTTLDGTIIWQVNGNFGQTTTAPYRPTWFATPPNSEYIYLCDGYGSNNVYVFDRKDGKFTNHTFGGKGDRSQHGKFSTNHGCTYDPRLENTIVVSDRANSRLEFFEYDPASPAKFEYTKTVDLLPQMGAGTLPCNIRMYPEQDGRAIVPDLSGPVAVLDKTNTVISVVNVSVLLNFDKEQHPHDAMFLPNGDMVVATWNPGRVSYWKKL